MGIKSIFGRSDKNVDVYLGSSGATFEDMVLQDSIKTENQKTIDCIKDELMKLSKDEIIGKFIKFLEESGECCRYIYSSQNTAQR